MSEEIEQALREGEAIPAWDQQKLRRIVAWLERPERRLSMNDDQARRTRALLERYRGYVRMALWMQS